MSTEALAPARSADSPAKHRGRRYDVGVIALLTALTLVYFYPLFLGRTNSILGPYGSFVYPWASVPNDYGLTQPQTDYAELSYPWLVTTDDALQQHTVPLWSANTYGGGYDLYANGSSAVLYPPRLLSLLVTSPVRAHDLFLVFHVWASAIAMYLLARELSLGRLAGTFAAVAWMFATWNTGWMQLEVVTPMALFLPATIAAVHRAMTRRSARATLGAGAVCALAAMSGHALLLGVTLFVAAGYAAALAMAEVVRRGRRGPTSNARHLRRSFSLEVLSVGGRLALLGVVAATLAAVLLVPTVLALRAGQRVPLSYAELRDQFLAEPFMFKRLLLAPSVPIDADDMQYLGFAGSLTAPLALIGCCSRRRPGAWFARAVLVVVPLVMLGTPLTWLAWRAVPGMNVFRPYSRLMVLVAFAMVVAAGLGVQVVLDVVARHRPAQASLTKLARVAMAIVVLATAGQLMWLGRRSNPPFVPHEARYALPSTPLVEVVREHANADGWPSRTMPVLLRRKDNGELTGLTFYANTPEAVRLDTTSGYDSNLDRRSLTLLRILNGADPTDATLGRYPGAFVSVFESWSTRFALLARLGITDVVTVPEPPNTELAWDPAWAALGAEKVYAGPDGVAYRVPGATAGPYLVAADEVVETEHDGLTRFVDPAFRADRALVVERGELSRTGASPLGLATAGAGAPGLVQRAERGVNTVSIEVDAQRPGWVVVPDAWAKGWSATVNGRSTPIVRVNYNQRAVRVEPGPSNIAMRYRPPGFVLGATVSALSAGLCLLAAVWLTIRAAAERRRSARRRLELEDELVAEQARVQRDAHLVDAGDQAPAGPGGGRPV